MNRLGDEREGTRDQQGEYPAKGKQGETNVERSSRISIRSAVWKENEDAVDGPACGRLGDMRRMDGW